LCKFAKENTPAAESQLERLKFFSNDDNYIGNLALCGTKIEHGATGDEVLVNFLGGKKEAGMSAPAPWVVRWGAEN